jgi:hypothetical protein
MNCLCCFDSIVCGPLIGKFCCLAYDWVVKHVAAIVEGISQLTEAHFGSYIPLILYAFNRIELCCPVCTGCIWLILDWLAGFMMCYFILSNPLALLLHSLAIDHATWSSFSLICWSDVLITLHNLSIVASLCSHRTFWHSLFCFYQECLVLLMVKLCALIGFVDLLLPMVVKRWFVASFEY